MDKMTTPPQRFLVGPVLVVVFAHAAGDFYAAFYGSLVPYLTAKLELSLVAVGVLAALFAVTSNFLQPIIGHLGEIFGRRFLIAGGVCCAGVGMSLLAEAGSFGAVSVLLLIGGLGVGSFHPCGASLAGESGGSKRAMALSLYFVGGNLGVMLAPLLVTIVVETRPRALALLGVPGIAAATFLWIVLKREPRKAFDASTQESKASPWEVFKKVCPICVHVVLRFIPIAAFFVLLPLHGTLRGLSQIEAGRLLALFLAIGTAGMLSGGYLSDRLARKPLMVASELAGGLMLMIAPGLNGSLFYIILAVGGFLAYIAMPLQILMAQERVPKSGSAASGIVMGFAYGVAMLALIPLGWLGDHWSIVYDSKLVGVSHELRVAAAFMVLAAVMALFLGPRREHRSVSNDNVA